MLKFIDTYQTLNIISEMSNHLFFVKTYPKLFSPSYLTSLGLAREMDGSVRREAIGGGGAGGRGEGSDKKWNRWLLGSGAGAGFIGEAGG
jgi:hypothetical protein